jgi:hypothetical protein
VTSENLRQFRIKPASFDDFAWTFQSARIATRMVRLLITELRSPVQMPLSRSVRGWRLGFGKQANLVYQIDKNDPQLFISQVQQVTRCPLINGHYDHLLNNKLLFPNLMEAVYLEGPSLIAFKRKGRLQDNQGGLIRNVEDWLARTLERWRHIVLKPIKGQKGLGLAFVKLEEQDLVVNGSPSDPDQVVTLLEETPDSVITEYVQQAEYARTLYPRTANTLRVLTIWDYDSGTPFIAATAQRIGTERSFPTDHWLAGMGGLSCEVNLADGSLSMGATISTDWKLVWHEVHPETQVRLEDTVIPGWDQLRQRLVKAARRLPWAPQIAWDILVTDKGFKVIELNGSPGLPVHQVHRPLLADLRCRNFFKIHGVID